MSEKYYSVELVTDDVICNRIEIPAQSLEKITHQCLLIDGKFWFLPEDMGLSFAEVIDVTEEWTREQKPSKRTSDEIIGELLGGKDSV